MSHLSLPPQPTAQQQSPIITPTPGTCGYWIQLNQEQQLSCSTSKPSYQLNPIFIGITWTPQINLSSLNPVIVKPTYSLILHSIGNSLYLSVHLTANSLQITFSTTTLALPSLLFGLLSHFLGFPLLVYLLLCLPCLKYHTLCLRSWHGPCYHRVLLIMGTKERCHFLVKGIACIDRLRFQPGPGSIWVLTDPQVRSGCRIGLGEPAIRLDS